MTVTTVLAIGLLAVGGLTLVSLLIARFVGSNESGNDDHEFDEPPAPPR